MSTTERKGRGKSKASIELIEASLKILTEIQPASVRAVCYRLFTMGLLSSMAKSQTDRVSRQLVWARENDVIPWAWIVDETRAAERIATWRNPDALIRAAVDQYRRNYWADQPRRVEVWSEKGTVRGTLAPVLDEYGVTFRVMHGFSSATAIYGVADETRGNDKPLHVLYLGDWDPSGMNMSERDIPNRFERYEGSAIIGRIALTADDIGDDLPSFPASTKAKDPRYRWFVENYGRDCWELDAMSPNVLRHRVEYEIARRIDQAAWQRAIEVEGIEIQSMADFHRAWQSRLSAGGVA